MDTARDASYLARAIGLAERGRGTSSPNPMVGCVIANEGQVVAEGWHERAGQPHAEAMALAAAGDRAAGGTAYVTLEPCDHRGRTPPCSQALVRAGIRRVVFGLSDPNPVAAGGRGTLAAAGVEVSAGLLADVVARQNRAFLTNVGLGRPDVTLKLAQTATGGLVAEEGRWVTGAAARRHVHRLRARTDGVLVGVGTVVADDPRLDVRHVRADRQPRPVVLDSTGRTPTSAQVVRPGAIVVTTGRAGSTWTRALRAAGVEVVTVPADRAGRVDAGEALQALLGLGVHSLLAEPGATLSAALVGARLVDRCVVHVAGSVGPVTLAPCLAPPGGGGWRTVLWRRLGDDREMVLEPTEDH